jgi:hypothetical protein
MGLFKIMINSEKAIQKSMTRPRRSGHNLHREWVLVGVMPGGRTRSDIQRFLAANGARLPFSEVIGSRLRIFSFSRVVSQS